MRSTECPSSWKWYHSKALDIWCGFLFVFHSNYGPILYHFRDAIYLSKIAILGERYYVTLAYIVAMPFICCRTCLWHLGRLLTGLNFSALFPHRLIAYRDSTVFVKILYRNSRGYMSMCKWNGRDMKNWRFSTNVEKLIVRRYLVAFVPISKMIEDMVIVTMEDE